MHKVATKCEPEIHIQGVGNEPHVPVGNVLVKENGIESWGGNDPPGDYYEYPTSASELGA
mgnify:CR=1 FL=1